MREAFKPYEWLICSLRFTLKDCERFFWITGRLTVDNDGTIQGIFSDTWCRITTLRNTWQKPGILNLHAAE
jgi:hypothetical protein